MKMRTVWLLCIPAVTVAVTHLSLAAHPDAARAGKLAPPGQATYDRACASCHSEADTGAPTRNALRAMTPEAILNALVNGKMQQQGSALSDADRRAVSEFLAARPLGATPASTAASKCATSPAMTDPSRGASWNGWGNGTTNARYAKDGGVTAADLPKLKLKWAFGYANINAARAQPAYAGGRLFVASENAEVHALDPKTGCTHWTFVANGGIRSALIHWRHDSTTNTT